MSISINRFHIIRRGLRQFGPEIDNFVLIFIHDLESWTESRLWEFLSKKNFKM